MSVSRTVSEIFSVKEWRDLKTGGRGRSRSLERLNTTIYWSAIIYIALFSTVFSYLMLKNIVTLKSGLDCHSNWYHSRAWVQFPICLP